MALIIATNLSLVVKSTNLALAWPGVRKVIIRSKKEWLEAREGERNVGLRSITVSEEKSGHIDPEKSESMWLFLSLHIAACALVKEEKSKAEEGPA